MRKPQKKLVMTVVAIVSLIAITVLGAGYYFNLPQFVSEIAWVFLTLCAVILIFSVVVKWYLERVRSRFKYNKYRRMFDSGYLDLKAELALGNNDQKVPWYVAFVDRQSLASLERENALPLGTLPSALHVYYVRNSLMWVLNVSEGDADLPNLFLRWAQTKRPRRTFNGALLVLDVYALITRKQLDLQAIVATCKSSLQSLYHRTSVVLPLHLFLRGIDKLDGLSEAVHTVEDIKDLSVTLSVVDDGEAKSEGGNTGALSQAYDSLFRSIFSSGLRQVAAQLDQDFKRKQLLGPFQLVYLKRSLLRLADALTNYNGLKVPFRIASLSLLDDAGSDVRVDIVSAHALIQLNQTNLRAGSARLLSPRNSLFSAYAESILPSANEAPIDKKQLRRYWLKQALMALFVVGIMLVTSVLGYVSYEYAQKQDAYYKKMISSYELSLKGQKFDVENPETTIASLHILHLFREDLISAISDKPRYVGESFLFSYLVGDQSRIKQFDAFYQKQLSLGLVPAIVRYLQGEMFVYLELNQQLQLINSKRVYDHFCSDDAASEAAVTAYLDESLSQTGMLSVGHRAQFLRLMSDFYELDFNAVPSCEYRKKELMPLVDKELESVNKRPLLYAYIESRPELRRSIDIRSELFANATELFEFKAEYKDYRVPLLYTPLGMKKVSFLSDSHFMRELLVQNRALFESEPTPIEIEQISSYLSYAYVEKYVAYWKNLERNISVTDVDLNTLVGDLTGGKEPVKGMYSVLTRFIVASPEVKSSKKIKEIAQSRKLSLALNKGSERLVGRAVGAELGKEIVGHSSAEEVQTEQARIAGEIEKAFRSYPLITGNAAERERIYSAFDASMMSLKAWKVAMEASVVPGEFLFNDFIGPKTNASFSGLWQGDQGDRSDRLTRELSNLAINKLNEQVKTRLSSYLQSRWQKEVVAPFSKSLGSLYPFEETSTQDVPLDLLESYFNSQGPVSKFNKEVFSHFVEVNGGFELVTFNKNQTVTASSAAAQYLNGLARIQKQLLDDAGKKIEIEINISELSMSPLLTLLQIISGEVNILYRHGPRLRERTVWPDSYSDTGVTLRVSNSSKKLLEEEFPGVWGIFRMLDKYRHQGSGNNYRVKLDDDLEASFTGDFGRGRASQASDLTFLGLKPPHQF